MDDIDYKDCITLEHAESDEEEHEGYFLQQSVNSYDIKEKIKSANEELFEEYHSDNDYREQRVTFNDTVDFEPYYSSDDGYVQSPYALGCDDIENEPEFIYQPIEEEIEEIPEINEEIEEEIINEEFCNEIIIQEEISESKTDENIIEIIQDSEIIDETDLEISVIHCDEETPKLPVKKKKYKQEKMSINCRIHCLEKPELDLINKGCDTKNMKTFEELNLKLIRKKCCKNQDKVKLPTYNGTFSEYGLTERQIERKRIKTDKKERQRREKLIRIEEEKMQRDLYNEEIFCAWLKSIEIRNKNKKSNKNCYQSYHERKRPQSGFEVSNNKYKNIRPRTATGQNHYNTIILYPGVTMKTLI